MNDAHQFLEDETTRIFRGRQAAAPASIAKPTRREARSTPDAPGLWDANDVARYLKVSRSWVYHRAEAGLLPCLRVGGLLRFDPDIVRKSARGG